MHAIRQARRDRIALAHRVIGAAGGVALVAWAFAASSWSSAWGIGAFALVTSQIVYLTEGFRWQRDASG